MMLNFFIILLFITALVFISLLYRKSTLDNLSMLDGESVLFEEKGVRVEQGSLSRTTVFIGCIVRVTDMRIIIAQKMLLSKSGYALRHVITYDAAGEGTDLAGTFKKGYLNFRVRRSDIGIEMDGGRTCVRIDIPESALTRGQYVRYVTRLADNYKNL